MKKSIACTSFALLALVSASCTKSYEDQSAALSNYVSKHRVGSTSDYYLVKTNIAGQPERVALIYGMAPDFEFCQETAQLYMRKYPASHFACEQAN
ncbi:hypothetical protein [Xanthomonas citri]|uniref:hypothetical protein n=1 Tax=Xanthomonas citri TaxID=346 RepID=UPI0012FE3DE6|nr:hypothetical protein [Xanthomonas citri]